MTLSSEKKLMQPYASYLGDYGTVSIAADDDVTWNDFLAIHEAGVDIEREKAVPSIKLQKKGTIQVVTVALSEVETWEDLLRALERHFPSSGTEPQITSFDGNLITSPEDYRANLKPGLHLIAYYPPTIDEISNSLDSLFFDNISSTTGSFKLSSNSYFYPPAPTPGQSHLANYLNPYSSEPKPSDEPVRYHLQPPNLYFTVSAPTSISITLSNSTFKNIAYYPGESYREHRDSDNLTAIEVLELYSPVSSTAPSGNRFETTPGSRGSSSDHTAPKEGSGLATKPSDFTNLSKWSSSTVYGKTNQAEAAQEEELKSKPFQVASGGLFPMTSFDLFAQSQRKRVLCSIGWDVHACPLEGLKDIVSNEPISSVSWRVIDGTQMVTGYSRTSEKRVYAHFEGYVSPEDDIEDCRGMGWWMVGPRKLPTSFSGKMGKHTFLLNGVAEVAVHLRAFMTRCGIGEDAIEGFTNYWIQSLEHSDSAAWIAPKRNYADTPLDHSITGTSTPKLILLKFLNPRDLRKLLPVFITPEPHRIVRLFAVFRVIEQGELDAEGIDPCGDFETEVDKVLGGIGSCGGGWDCGHRGFKVAEVGGVRVFGNSDKIGGQR